MDDKYTPIINKIEIDEETAEPRIVEVSVDEIELKPKEVKQEPVFSARQYGKQLVMKQVLGLDVNSHTTSKRQKLLKRIMSLSFIVIILAVLAITFYHDFLSPEAMANPPKWSDIISSFSDNWFYVLLALLALLVCFLSKGFKLSVMCKSMTGKWRFKTCF